MKKTYSTLFLTTVFMLSAGTVQASVEHGQKLFKQSCSFCHGNNAEKSALNQSKILNQLPANEIVNSLKARKEGQIVGAGNAAKSRLSPEDIQAIADFIQTLK